METVGIVAEYNPFHLGHALHIDHTRRVLGKDVGVVCVLSGDFVQRGEGAAFSKYARAEAACRCGADLAVELPLPWSLSSAEGFARGAVSMLAALGCTVLSFGSECGEIEPLEQLAKELADPAMQERVRGQLNADPTLSYAAARQRAAAELLGAERASLLEQPNNILAVEYLKAIRELDLRIDPLTLRRRGAQHDGEGGAVKSAREVRHMLYQGAEIGGAVPREALAVYEREKRFGRALPDRDRLETAMLSRLRALDGAGFASLPDAQDGIGVRLGRAARTEPTIDAVLAAAGTKRYALSRLRRMLCCAALGVTAEDAAGLPPYARVLAVTERGRELLRAADRRGEIPLISKPAAVKELSPDCARLFELTSRAHDLWVLGCPAAAERRGGGDYRKSPVILP